MVVRKAIADQRVTDAPKVIEDRTLADRKANAVKVTLVRKPVVPKVIVARKAIAAPKAAVLTVNAVKETVVRKPVVRKGIAHKKAADLKGIVVPRHEARKGAAPRETVVRTDRADRCSFANSTRTTTVASRRTSWPNWWTSSMNSTQITTDNSIRSS